jgi:DNA-binding NarL/FixJ family response regulator
MASRHPSSTSTKSAFPSRPRRDLLAAHHLQHLTTSLTISWDSLAAPAREALVREIQQAVNELGSTTDPSASAPAEGADVDPLHFLTPRERQVLNGLAAGASTRELAAQLGLSVSTVRSYVKAVLSKLGVHSRLEAVILLLETGNGAGRDRANHGSDRRRG